jgi:uncharacterized RDD family membrane protein YckC
MNTSMSQRLAWLLLSGLLLVGLLPAAGGIARAQSTVSGSAPGTPSDVQTGAEAPGRLDEAPGRLDEWRDEISGRHRPHHHNLVNIGRDSDLPRGQRADSVVSILGSSSSEGEAREVVSVLGNTRVTGPVSRSAVAVLGNTYVDSTIDGDVVAVLGNVELGPNADVAGDVVALGGTVQREATSTVHGTTQSVAAEAAGFVWLRPWIEHCLLYGRPLAWAPGIGWAWSLALALLALYAGLALLFRDGITQCVHTLETQPGMTVLAALLTVLLAPILLVLLCITVLGIAAVPFVVLGLFCAGLFGKAVVLTWLGRRCLGTRTSGALAHPVSALLIGGVIVLALYLVPVLGFIVYKLLGLLGLGAVVYTLILSARALRVARGDGLGASAPPRAATMARTDAPPAAASAADPSVAAAAAAAASASPAPAAPGIAPAPGIDPAPGITAALPHAGFWIRMAALLLDALLVGFLMGVLHHAFHMELLVLAAYGAVMWKLRGSTVGGIVFDLQVMRLDGRAVDWETAIVRALACFLSLAVAGLGFFWIAFDDAKQAWHDKIAGTVVVRVAKRVSLV